MRCKCCDSTKGVRKWGDDWYCSVCRAYIKEDINEFKMIYPLKWDKELWK